MSTKEVQSSTAKAAKQKGVKPAREMASAILRTLLRKAAFHIGAVPFTVAVLALYLLSPAIFDSDIPSNTDLLKHLTTVSGGGLKSGDWWSIWTSMLFAVNPFDYVMSSLVLVVLLGSAERKLGWLRTGIAFIGGQFATVTVFLLAVQLAAYADDGWLGQMMNSSTSGPVPATLLVSTAASGLLPTLWRRRLRATVLSLALLLVLYVGDPGAVMALTGALLGLIAGVWLQLDQGIQASHRATRRETRNLLSLMVAIFGVGPLVAGAVRSPTGPLSLLREMVLNPVPTITQLQANCGGTVDISCLQLGREGYPGPAGVALAVVPALLLLICAAGMRQGRRLALTIAIGVQLGVVALSFAYLVLFASIPHFPRGGRTVVLGSAVFHILTLALVPLVLAVLLFVFRGNFVVGSRAPLRRKMALLVGGTWLVLAAAYTGAWLGSGGMTHDGGILGLLAELARQYLPLPIPTAFGTVFAGRTAAESILFAWSGIIFWLVALAAVWTLLLKRQHGSGGEDPARRLARDLVKRGGESLSWMALWEPNRFWFTPVMDAGIAYQQHGNVALTLGGPFGEPGQARAATEGFLDYCAHHALVPCLYSCTGELWSMLQASGFRRVAVAQETRLAVRDLEFTGKAWQNVRTARNRAEKAGINVRWGRYSEFSQHIRSQLGEVSEEWAARKKVPEMGFTLGSLDELMDDDVLCCIALDSKSYVYAVTSWLPVFRDGHVVSWTLDFMRRRGDSFPGIMEFMIAAAVQELRQGVEVISLSGSPLAGETDEFPSGEAGMAGILDLVARTLEPVYGFRSLARFKSRFQPEYRTLYMYYQDSLEIPAIGAALSRAYLPGLSVRHTARLLRTLVV
ncbi:bifunctional lysylphosphatidylglycerol flippase/synthetase MprF [bacterium RCC_150]